MEGYFNTLIYVNEGYVKDNKTFRNMCIPCPIKTVTQGSIFNYATNEDYNNTEDLGLIISARCDLSKGATQKFSFIPVISLDKYVRHQIMPQLIGRVLAECRNQVGQLLKSEGLSERLEKVYGAEKAMTLLPDRSNLNKKVKQLSDKLRVLRNAAGKPWNELTSNDYYYVKQKVLASEIQLIAENKKEGYFYIDCITDFNDENRDMGPHIACLREVHHIDAGTVELLSRGFYHKDVLEKSKNSVEQNGDKFSYVLCNIKSPYIELIMQRFASLFSRIGVENPNISLINDHASRLIEGVTS